MARDFVPWAVERGCVVIDESGYWRMDPNVPLVMPEVNPDDAFKHKGIIASPNCSTTQMVVALKPLHDAGRVPPRGGEHLSGRQRRGRCRAARPGQRAPRRALAGKQYKYETFAHPIAFNFIPQIGSPKHQGYTSEEMKMVYETRKILDDDSIQVCPTCVRVPVSNCHSESILVETERKITVDEARRAVRRHARASWSSTIWRQGKYPMPINCDGRRRGVHRPHPRGHFAAPTAWRSGA